MIVDPGERRGGDDIQVGQPEHLHEAAGLLLPPREAAREVRLAVEAERARQPVSGAVRPPQGHRGSRQVGQRNALQLDYGDTLSL